MYKQFIKTPIAKSIVLAAALLALSPVQAAKIDLEKEILVKSESQSADLKNKILNYTKNVRITQGSLLILADSVQALKNGNDEDVYIAKGNPATFEQKLEDGTLVKLSAKEIRYEPDTFTITITGDAFLEQDGTQVRAGRITYNTLTEQQNAESWGGQDVTTILPRKSKVKE